MHIRAAKYILDMYVGESYGIKPGVSASPSHKGACSSGKWRFVDAGPVWNPCKLMNADATILSPCTLVIRLQQDMCAWSLTACRQLAMTLVIYCCTGAAHSYPPINCSRWEDLKQSSALKVSRWLLGSTPSTDFGDSNCNWKLSARRRKYVSLRESLLGTDGI